MIKNIVLILSIVLLSVIMILFAYISKDKDLCCRYELCSQITNLCKDQPMVLYKTSEKGVKLYMDDIQENAIVEKGTKLTGEITGSWFFEGEFPIRIINEDMEILETLTARATESWTTSELVPFEFNLDSNIEDTTNIILRFEKSNPSGLKENDDYIDFPIVLSVSIKYMDVNVYFPNTQKGSTEDCSLVFPVTRKIQQTVAVGRASLEELFSGVTEDDMTLGYYTNINEGVQIQDLTISSGVATVDFNQALQEGVGGSCKVTSIRAQIEETLKQFPTVETVIISIDGEVEDILQP